MYVCMNVSEIPRGVVVNELDCDIIGREFEFKSRYYVPFGIIPFWKVWTSLSLSIMG